jgi:hypothetical protein
MAKKKRFSIDPRDKKNARKSIEELMKEKGNRIIGDDIQGGWVEYIIPPNGEPTENDTKK